MPEFKDIYYPSSTGKNTIHARVCTPSRQPKAIVQIVHGIAEHIDRYDDFAAYLAENGYVVVGEDHLGHGKSVTRDEEKGLFAEENGWSYVLKDMDILRETIRKEYPELPYVFFGHSMGSFLTRNYIIDNPEKYDAAIISGTGQQSPLTVAAGYAMANMLVNKDGPRASGETLDKIAFGSYCNKIENPRTKFDWLSRDKDTVDKYIADPMCGFVCAVSLYRDMMGGIKYISKQSNIDKMSKEQPIYFMSGDADPVGDYGKGVNKAYDAFCKAGLKDVMIRLYPNGRHEMLNETNRQDVYKDILNWLNAKVGA